MGTLLGHILPGTSFLLLGLWWTCNIWQRYWSARQQRRRFQATVMFPVRGVPWDSIAMLLLTLIGVTGEVVNGLVDGRLDNMGVGQHITMYLVFALAAVLEVAQTSGLGLVPGQEYVGLVMAYAAQFLLFAHHGHHGKSELEMLVHQLLQYVVMGCVLSTLAEMVYRHSVMAALARAFFTLLQGTWFFQVGFTIWPPPGWTTWDFDSMRHHQLATVVFVWHAVGVLMAVVTIGALLRLRAGARGRSPAGPSRQQDSIKLLESSEDEQ